MNWTATDYNTDRGNYNGVGRDASGGCVSVQAHSASIAAARFLRQLPSYQNSGQVFGVPLYLPATGRAVVPVVPDGAGWLCRDLTDSRTGTDSRTEAGTGVDPANGATIGTPVGAGGMPMVWASTVEIETAMAVDLCHRSMLLRGGFPVADRRFPLVWQARVHQLLPGPLVHRAARVLGRWADSGRHQLTADLSSGAALSGAALSDEVWSVDVAAGWAVPVDERAEWQLLRGVQLVRRVGLGQLLDRLHTAGLLASGWRVTAGGLQPVWWLVLPTGPRAGAVGEVDRP